MLMNGLFHLQSYPWGWDASQNYPPHLSAWGKAKMGFIVPTIVDRNATATYTCVSEESHFIRITDKQRGRGELASNSVALCVWSARHQYTLGVSTIIIFLRHRAGHLARRSESPRGRHWRRFGHEQGQPVSAHVPRGRIETCCGRGALNMAGTIHCLGRHCLSITVKMQ
jgi:hypothetical protein